MAHDIDYVRNALRGVVPDLHARANVVATGVGHKVTHAKRTSEICIVYSVTEKLDAAKLAPTDLIPPRVEGVSTDVVQTGRIRALQTRVGRHRPAPGGVSIGHRDITAGTLGCLVKKDGDHFILSNNHVLANSNDARRGDSILQPGPVDGGRLPADHIANLEDFVQIRFRQPEPPSDCPPARAVIAALNAICRAIGSMTRYQIVTRKWRIML